MGYISYIAAAVACLVAGLIMWWAFDRYQSRLAKGLFAGLAILLGFVIYFVSGIVLIPILSTSTSEASEAGTAIGHGFKMLSTLLLVVTSILLAIRGRSKMRIIENRPPANSN